MAFTNLKLKNPFWLAQNLPTSLTNTEKFQHLICKCSSKESLKQHLLKLKPKILKFDFENEEVYNILSLIAFAALFCNKDQSLTLQEVLDILEEQSVSFFHLDLSSSSSSSSDMDSS